MRQESRFDALFEGHMNDTLSPEEILQFGVLQSGQKTAGETAGVRTFRVKLGELLDRKIGDRFRNDEEVNTRQKERSHQALLRWAAKLRQKTTSADGLFPKLRLIREAIPDIQSAPQGTDVPVDLFMAMDEILEQHFRRHQPWWHKAAGPNIAELRQAILQYQNACASGSDDVYSLAMRLAQEYDETACSFLRCSQMDLCN